MNGKKLSGLGIVGLLLVTLVGCGAGNGQQTGVAPTAPASSADAFSVSGKGVFSMKLPDGYELTCIYAYYANSGGPSCDWPGHQAWKEKRSGQ